MKTRALKNYSASLGCEVYDIDLNSNEEIVELGKLYAQNLIVYINQQISTARLNDIMCHWGDPSRALIHNLVANGSLNGRHWRELYLTMGLAAKDVKDLGIAVSTISYKTDSKNRAMGMFTNGELDWHSDQCAFDDAPRVIGLQSVANSANSQTQFLCTHDAYELLSSEMKSIVKELICIHKWVDNLMAPGLNHSQTQLLKYNMCPVPGLETKLYSESILGLPGIKFPSHTFDKFKGMSRDESLKLLTELKSKIYQEKYIYTQNWEDGQIVFMDQEITLHKRPTNVTHGSKRHMSRVITYLNKIFPAQQPRDVVSINGELLSHNQFAQLVDQERVKEFKLEEGAIVD